jgi:hypothetical protein
VKTGTQVALRAAPTRVRDGSAQAEPGLVKIRAMSGPKAAKIDAYLCWGGRNLGYTLGSSQAQWVVLDQSGKAVIDGHGSLLGDACGKSPHLWPVGGYVGSTDAARFERASYSATGPTRGARKGPRLLALSESDSATRGVPGPGTRSGRELRVWGTSVAVAGAGRVLLNDQPRRFAPRPSPSDPEEAGEGFLV